MLYNIWLKIDKEEGRDLMELHESGTEVFTCEASSEEDAIQQATDNFDYAGEVIIEDVEEIG